MPGYGSTGSIDANDRRGRIIWGHLYGSSCMGLWTPVECLVSLFSIDSNRVTLYYRVYIEEALRSGRIIRKII